MNLQSSIFYAMKDNQVINQHVDLLMLTELLVDTVNQPINYFKWQPMHGNTSQKINVVKSGAPEQVEYEALDGYLIGKLILNESEIDICMVTLPSELSSEDEDE